MGFLVLLSGTSLGEPQKSHEIEVKVATVEKVKTNLFKIHITITNQGEVPLFFPKIGLGKPLEIYTLEIERFEPGRGWVALPRHRELMHSYSDAVRIKARETYDDEFLLDDPYVIPYWISFPHSKRVISLRGKLMLRVSYFAGSEEWDAYLSKLKAGEQLPARADELLKKARRALSEPFQLPRVGTRVEGPPSENK